MALRAAQSGAGRRQLALHFQQLPDVLQPTPSCKPQVSLQTSAISAAEYCVNFSFEITDDCVEVSRDDTSNSVNFVTHST